MGKLELRSVQKVKQIIQNLKAGRLEIEGASPLSKLGEVQIKESARIWDFVKIAKQRQVGSHNQALRRSVLDPILNSFSKDSIVLDAGCGEEEKYTGKKKLLIGVDLSEATLNRNKKVDVKICADVCAMPVERESIDRIVSFSLLEHLECPELFFKEVSRVLRQKGEAVILTENLYGYKNMIASFLLRLGLVTFAWKKLNGTNFPYTYGLYYRANTKWKIKRLAKSTGLSIKKVSYFGAVPHFFYPYPALCFLAFLYDQLLGVLHLNIFKNCMVLVLQKE